MPTPAPFAIESNGPDVFSNGASTGDRASHGGRALRYQTLLLLTLGLAVVLWGSWWKFSEYNPHPDPPQRALAARLWAGPLPDFGL
ncbi:MAG: hypothetical protein ACRD3S_12780, partial [Terracidiphilus sp.]